MFQVDDVALCLLEPEAAYGPRQISRIRELLQLLSKNALSVDFPSVMLKNSSSLPSNRTIYWFVTNHLKENERSWVHDHEVVFGYSKYKQWLKHWGRDNFDCFRRGPRVQVSCGEHSYVTTCAQLNFFFFVWKYGYLKMCVQHLQTVRETQREGARRKRSKKDRKILTKLDTRCVVCSGTPVVTQFVKAPSPP